MKKIILSLFIACFISLLSSCGLVNNYYSPKYGATVRVKGTDCSASCYVDGKLTWGNTFRIPIDKNTTISIKGKKQISNGYYVARFSYTLNPKSIESSADIIIDYKGDGKFGNSINVKGMSVVFE